MKKEKTSLNRLVYSTDGGQRCMSCGWPAKECRCSTRLAAPPEAVPRKIAARLRLEKRASDKSVTVIEGLPGNASFLESLAKELKKGCGCGGYAGEASVELQGDQRERVRELLQRKGWTVKG
jgi:translation initiation factor 1